MQMAPFVYLLFLTVGLLSESFLPEWAVRTMDNMLNAPLYAMAGLLGAGRLLKLCQWFRAACLLPIVTKVEGWVDAFIFSFTQNEIIWINICLGVIFLAYLIIALHHFFHGLKTAA